MTGKDLFVIRPGIMKDACAIANLGRKFVESIEQWARENGAAVTIRSNVARPESHHFYQALGYVRSKEQATYLKPC